ncbi:MAG TPA: sugar ABC transporter permease [Candidatus Limnocylindrales bacterium]
MKLTTAERGLLYGPLAIVVSIWLLIPALLGLVSTFTNYAPTESSVAWVGLHNFQSIISDRTFAAAIRNIGIFTLVAVPLQLIIGFCVADALRRPFRGRTLVRIVLLLPWLVSPIASGVMWHFLLGSETGFLGFGFRSIGLPAPPSPLSQHGLALLTVVLVETWRVAPLVAFLLLPGLASIPRERWEDATIDGLRWLGQIRHVAIPALRPLILAVTMLLIGGSLATFDSVLSMTGGGPGTETVTPALYSYNKAFTFSDWPIGAASGWLIGGAVLVAGLAYLRLSRKTER